MSTIVTLMIGALIGWRAEVGYQAYKTAKSNPALSRPAAIMHGLIAASGIKISIKVG